MSRMPSIQGLDTDKPYILRADGGKTYTPTRSTSFERSGGSWGKEQSKLGQDQIRQAAERALEREKRRSGTGQKSQLENGGRIPSAQPSEGRGQGGQGGGQSSPTERKQPSRGGAKPGGRGGR